jgi:hypothetical protein
MKLPIVLLGVLVACGGDDGSGRLADAPVAHIVVEPADLTVTVTNDVAVMQPYTARLVGDKGLDVDVTAETTFSLADAAYGTFSGATLSITGGGAGPTRVQASARGSTGDAGLTVRVKKVIIDPTGPADPATLFANATEDATRAPTIAYPLDKILVPPNLGQFDVHWRNGQVVNDLFEVTMANSFVDVRIYTKGTDAQQPFWTVFAPDTWYPIASSREQLTLKVAGLSTAAPTTKGTAAAQKVDVTNENSQGGIYYWTSSSPAGVWRYDIAKPNVAPAPFWDQASAPSGCMGCHVLSRDGKRMAITLDSAGGRGAVYTVADRKAINDPNAASPLRWNFATFNAAADKLVTIESGKMFLRAADGTALSTDPLPSVATGAAATHPELAPDDKHLVNAEFTQGDDLTASVGSIVIRTFDNATNTFGTPTVLVPAGADYGNYYPSFSPDSKWIAFTRTRSVSYDDHSAENWLVKADGSAPPIQLGVTNLTGDLTNSWARWVPFGQTFGAQNEPMFYLTFSSRRPFGVRIPGGGQPQIWMTPIFPARAEAGMDPSGNAFRVPFQNVTTSNHIAQWTQAIQ